jgi:hypothetical protein
MKLYLRMNVLMLIVVSLATAQTQPTASKPATPQKRTGNPPALGTSYANLRPEQKRLVDDYVRRYNETTKSKFVSQVAYDNSRLSVRTTFDAVTHALLGAKITDSNGKSLGRAIDLVDAVDEVMGQESGVGGDRQFRLYVYLKPTAVDTLNKSQEFLRERDNTVYHKGFPICYRLKNGPPSIQVSISRDKRMADIDVDYRSSNFPQGLFNGHLTASNSDVRAGDNLQRHDDRWAGLNGWWREVFGLLGSGGKPPKEEASERLGHIPLNPGVKADQGIDKSVHDFLQKWVVAKQPNVSAAYFSRRSYPCLEQMAQKNRKPMAPGMVRLRTEIAMKKFSDTVEKVNAVEDVFEAADAGSQDLQEAKNSYASEFRLLSVPADIAEDEQCVAAFDDESDKKTHEKYYATAFRGKQGGSRNKVMALLWAQEGGYWKIIAIRIDDGEGAPIVPKNPRRKEPGEAKPQTIAGDPEAAKDINKFYSLWIGKRQVAQAAQFASERSYACLSSPSPAEKKLASNARIRAGLARPLERLPQRANLSDMMSGVQPVNELLRPVEHQNSRAFAIMAVPDQMADSFLCQNRHLPEKSPELKPAAAKYGAFYVSSSRLK